MIMKKLFSNSLITLVAATALSGCAAQWNFDEIGQMPTDQAYLEAAKTEYLNIAKVEYSESDYSDSSYFLDKARMAANGETPAPQMVGEREIAEPFVADLTAAYEALASMSGPKAWTKAPAELARAQAQYDCWLQEQEEGFQKDHIQACRTEYEKAMAALTEIMSRREDLFVVLPHEDGSVGGIEIDDGHTKVVLDKAFSATRTGAAKAQAFDINETEVHKVFAAALASQPIPPKSFTLYFQQGSTDLVESSKPEILKVFSDIERRKAAEVLVIGHTDSVGSVSANDELGLMRAKSVLDFLIEKGIQRDAIQAAGRGERELLVKTGDAVPNTKNRRVEINIR